MSDVRQTEFKFQLPLGYRDENGTCYREGVMRLATAGDEILPMKDPRVQSNPEYLAIILLARVIIRLGSMETLNTNVIENLYAQDFNYLQDLYNRINETGSSAMEVQCPKCDHNFTLALEDPEMP